MATLKQKLDDIATQVHELASSGGTAASKQIQDALIRTQQSLETPFETIMRIYDLDFQHTASRIGADLKIFVTLANSKTPLTVQDLQKVNGAAEQLLGRVLRYLASINHIDEVSKDTFAANNITRTLAHPDFEGGIRLSFDVQGPTNSALPDLLVEKKFQNITSASDTAFNKARGTDLPCFQWLKTQPKHFDSLHKALQIQHREDWLIKFPLEKHLGDFDSLSQPDKVLFVDVGGSYGIQCAGLKAKYPQLTGRIINEDLAETLTAITPVPGIENLAQDYLSEQKIKDAKFYYYRNIFHDNPDERCRLILKGLGPAVGSGSLLLIDDKVLPDSGVHRHVTMLDLAMMAQVASLERTIEQWTSLLNGEGWEIVEIVTYSDEYDSVLVVKKT